MTRQKAGNWAIGASVAVRLLMRQFQSISKAMRNKRCTYTGNFQQMTGTTRNILWLRVRWRNARSVGSTSFFYGMRSSPGPLRIAPVRFTQSNRRSFMWRNNRRLAQSLDGGRNYSFTKGVKGFFVLAKRWVVERTFAWLSFNRRLSKDYEYLPETSETFIRVAM